MQYDNILKGLNKVSAERDFVFDSARFITKGLNKVVKPGFKISKKIFGGKLGILASASQLPDLYKKTSKNTNFNNNNNGLDVSKKFYTGDFHD